MNRLQRIERSLAPGAERTAFHVGDTVRVHVKVVEGGKERIQVFEGAVIARAGETNRETFTVRKVSYNTGVERLFPLNSPKIEKIEVLRKGRVRRAKLYYLRERRGKAARIVERDMRGKLAARAALAEAAVPAVEPEAPAPEPAVETAQEAPEAVAEETTVQAPKESPEGETPQEASEPASAEPEVGDEPAKPNA